MERKSKGIKKPIQKKFRKRQRSNSIFFLIWSVFTAFTVVFVLLFGVSQQVVFSHTYKQEAFKELTTKGTRIEREVLLSPPAQFGDNYSGYLRYLSRYYGLDIYLLDSQGDVLFPQENNFAPELKINYSKVLQEIKKRLDKEKTTRVVFEGDGEYVYGCECTLIEGAETYLYIGKSLSLITASVSKMGSRMTMVAVFILVLSFAISSAVSGWLTKPLSEMSEKAKRLAKGDFEVDFHGANYGEEMVELAQSLNFARDELAKTDQMQKELIANVSHDFKTPLTMIKAYASMIQEISGDIPEKRDKHAQVIIEETDRLATLVTDVLDLSKIQSGMEEMKQNVFDMSTYTLEIIDRFTYLKETQGYQFITDIDEELYTCGDELKIGQVLYNLIGNAVNYTGEDKKVYVKLKKSVSTFRFEVRDTGKGIKNEELAVVWDRYYRSKETHKRPVKGMGLGLSIVKTILQKHGFAFGVESQVGKGSTFYVDFPLVDSEE